MSTEKPVGLVVVVKDEVHDIAGWLAWHVALGFDTIFVVDDGSTDGTDWVVKAAAKSFDIRYSKVIQDHSYFYERQQREYRKKLVELKGIFSWLCFLDADEYLLLRTDSTISAFLAHFPDAAGIGLNWCLHGNNGHVLRPLVPAPAAYPKRSRADHEINLHVKSIVRPDRVGTTWGNVHWFDVEPDAYVNAYGESIQWSSTLGIVSGAPCFDIAHIMHFQNRSMEHFLDRARKRRDTFIDTRSWSNDEWNGEEDELPAHILTSMYEALVKIELQTSIILISAIEKRIRSPDFGAGSVSVGHGGSRLLLTFFSVKTSFGSFLKLDPDTNLVVHGYEVSDKLLPLLLVRAHDSPSEGLLVGMNGQDKPLRLLGGRQAATVIGLHVVPAGEERVALQLPETSLFLAAEPTELSDNARRVTANRMDVKDWERFTLSPLAVEEVNKSILDMAEAYFSMTLRQMNIRSIESWLKTYEVTVTSRMLQVLLRQMKQDDHSRFAGQLADVVPLELLSGSSYS